jgi:hypothetical protein
MRYGYTTYTLKVVDQCPGCGTNHLDLFPDAFSKLEANPGIIQTTWDFVDCGISTPLQLHNKEGVSAYWFSMQVVNANKGVKSLEVSTNGGSTWQATARQTYNFFENSAGFGITTVDVRVTSIDGDTVIVKNVAISAGASTTADSNFGSSGGGKPVEPATTVAPTTPTVTPQVPAPVQSTSAESAPVESAPETGAGSVPVAITTTAPVATTTQKPTKLVFTPRPTAVVVEDDVCEL